MIEKETAEAREEWGIGVLECWSVGFHIRRVHVHYSNTPLLHHSLLYSRHLSFRHGQEDMIEVLGEFLDRHKRVPVLHQGG